MIRKIFYAGLKALLFSDPWAKASLRLFMETPRSRKMLVLEELSGVCLFTATSNYSPDHGEHADKQEQIPKQFQPNNFRGNTIDGRKQLSKEDVGPFKIACFM